MDFNDTIAIVLAALAFTSGFELGSWFANRRIVQKARASTRLELHGRLYEVREYRRDEERHP